MSDADPADYTNLKVNELKKLLKARGLPLTGNKQELVDRLKNSEAAAEALLEGSDVGDGFDEDLERELDETALEDEPTKADEPTSSTVDLPTDDAPKAISVESKSNDTVKNGVDGENNSGVESSVEKKEEEASTTESKHPKITITSSTLGMSPAARKQLRAERFSGGGAGGEALKKRAERFALDKGGDDAKKVITASADTSENALKRRAERFGILSPAEVKRRHLEKLQARKLRFSSDGTTATAAATDSATAATPVAGKVSTVPHESNVIVNPAVSVDEKKRLRAERFKIKV